MSTARPTGATIVALLVLVSGVWQVIVGLGFAIPGGLLGGLIGGNVAPGAMGGMVVNVGLLTLVVGALSIAAGLGIWRLRPWAWTLAAIVAATSIALTLLSVLDWGTLISQLIGLALPAITLYLLMTSAVKAAFGRA